MTFSVHCGASLVQCSVGCKSLMLTTKGTSDSGWPTADYIIVSSGDAKFTLCTL